jgi:hypothetical protein
VTEERVQVTTVVRIFAKALHYFFQKHLGVDVVIHYVDDFLFVVEGPNKDRANILLANALALCKKLGVPMADEKTEGPCTCLVFLGILLDTVKMEASLAPDRLSALRQLTTIWNGKQSATIAEMQSLVGTLQFACKVIRPGRHFIARLIRQLTYMLAAEGQNHQSRMKFTLDKESLLDIDWWRRKAPRWNGVSLLYEVEWENATDCIFLATDACETGYGAWCNNKWFKGNWTPAELACATRKNKVSMPFLETYALALAAATWGHQWRGKKIVFRTDCMVSYHTVGDKKKNSKQAQLQALIRQLAELACEFEFDYRTEHIAGVTNTAADALSRDRLPEFFAIRPNSNQQPCPQRKDLLPMPARPAQM